MDKTTSGTPSITRDAVPEIRRESVTLPTTKCMMNRLLNREEVLVGFLKQMNTNGADIYIRPAESLAGVLVDDLDWELDRMDAEGCNPAAVTETSPQNYQAWVRLSHDHLDTS